MTRFLCCCRMFAASPDTPPVFTETILIVVLLHSSVFLYSYYSTTVFKSNTLVRTCGQSKDPFRHFRYSCCYSTATRVKPLVFICALTRKVMCAGSFSPWRSTFRQHFRIVAATSLHSRFLIENIVQMVSMLAAQDANAFQFLGRLHTGTGQAFFLINWFSE